MSTKRPILIDTDAGTDDAVALCMMMESGDFDIVGITTVGGNVSIDNVVQNVLYLTDNWGQSIDVYRGCAVPLCRPTQSADFIHGSDGLGDLGVDNHGRTPALGYAPEQIIRLSHEFGGELELLTLGPLTNIAVALALDPTLPSRISHCHIMGGLYDLPGNITPMSEYNIWADPEAAKAVLSAEWQMTLTGWDTTLQGGYLTPSELTRLGQQPHPLSHNIAKMQEVAVNWEKKNNNIDHCFLADAAAVAALLRPDIVTEVIPAMGMVICSDDAAEDRGRIGFDTEAPSPRIRINRGMDRSAFVDTVINTFGQ